MFDVSSNVSTYSNQDLIAIIGIGLIGGVLGAFFNYLVDMTLQSYSFINK